jgi:hypothetical protein
MTRKLVNLPASVANRLRNLARDQQADFNLILSRYAIERLLYRISVSDQRDRFILKGATLFTAWSPDKFRATRDLDLLGFGDPAVSALASAVSAICANLAPDDGLDFDHTTITAAPIRGKQEYGGVRIKLTARLASIRIPVQIDIGFGDAVTPAAVELDFPVLLADTPAPRLRAYPKETVVAEKFQAIVALGEVNTRMKDYYDLMALTGLFDFDGALLSAAIRATFERRQTPLPVEIPPGLTDSFAVDPPKVALWKAFTRREALLLDAGDFAAVIAGIRDFVLPPTAALAAGQPFLQHWPPGGPWEA